MTSIFFDVLTIIWIIVAICLVIWASFIVFCDPIDDGAEDPNKHVEVFRDG